MIHWLIVWLIEQANSDVISNITYHGVVAHKDDMEKKRSLQGGGENTKFVEEFRDIFYILITSNIHLKGPFSAVLWIRIIFIWIRIRIT